MKRATYSAGLVVRSYVSGDKIQKIRHCACLCCPCSAAPPLLNGIRIIIKDFPSTHSKPYQKRLTKQKYPPLSNAKNLKYLRNVVTNDSNAPNVESVTFYLATLKLRVISKVQLQMAPEPLTEEVSRKRFPNSRLGELFRGSLMCAQS